ncbi:hypothetical protein [Synoicihabitans lomoniglobus]|uniref:Uncharacterized protein n=1 Tax=Synoicihabitans lomoniglobus TaxID=2909285 RepID=A0AAF0CRT1_9BACT|nr:hypothetical protein [Opitutaceae bacterium LMO-M01]WED66858.1 hypothetical protein PXH66_08345 [Opitutaceae bacterium LMO-M01]
MLEVVGTRVAWTNHLPKRRGLAERYVGHSDLAELIPLEAFETDRFAPFVPRYRAVKRAPMPKPAKPLHAPDIATDSENPLPENMAGESAEMSGRDSPGHAESGAVTQSTTAVLAEKTANFPPSETLTRRCAD